MAKIAIPLVTSTYKTLVVGIDQFIEDAIDLVVEGFSDRCFVSYSLSKIEVGVTYEVEFDPANNERQRSPQHPKHYSRSARVSG